MRSLALIFLVGLTVIVLANGLPANDKKCNTVCTFIYEPVCATDGNVYMTFGNKCLLNKYNCENNTNFEVVFNGECPKCLI